MNIYLFWILFLALWAIVPLMIIKGKKNEPIKIKTSPEVKPKKKGGRKRRGKNDPLKVWEQIEKALKINIDKRKRFRAQNELFIETSNQQNEVTDHGTNENEMDMPKQYTVISPLHSSSAVLPSAFKTILSSIPFTIFGLVKTSKELPMPE